MRLSVFCLYKVDRQTSNGEPKVEVLHGASDVRVRADGHIELLASSAPFRTAKMQSLEAPPYSGIFALYGHKDEAEEMRYWRVYAHEIGAQFASVSFGVAVGDIHAGFVTPEILRASQGMFLNLRRTVSSIQSEVLESMQDLLAEEGGDPEKHMSQAAHIALRPDLFVRAFLDNRHMKKVGTVVFPVADDLANRGATRQVAFVRSGSAIKPEVLQMQSEASLLLPAWLSDKALAKRLATKEAKRK